MRPEVMLAMPACNALGQVIQIIQKEQSKECTQSHMKDMHLIALGLPILTAGMMSTMTS